MKQAKNNWKKDLLWTIQLFTSLQNLSHQAQEQKAPTGKKEAFGFWTGSRPLLHQQMFQFFHSHANLKDFALCFFTEKAIKI